MGSHWHWSNRSHTTAHWLLLTFCDGETSAQTGPYCHLGGDHISLPHYLWHLPAYYLLHFTTV